MDSNNFNVSNNNTEKLTNQNPNVGEQPTNPYSMHLDGGNQTGYGQQLQNVSGQSYAYGSNDANSTSQYGTYNSVNPGNKYATDTTLNSNDEVLAKKATTSMVLGIILCVLDMIMLCSVMLGGGFLYGGLFIILAVVGMQNAKQGMDSSRRSQAKTGRYLNIVALVFGIILFVIGILERFRV